jgi:hypothetical protein
VTIIRGADAYRHMGMQIDGHTGRAQGEGVCEKRGWRNVMQRLGARASKP